MKNTFLILFAGLLMSFPSQAQKGKDKKITPVKEVSVPENVTTTFKSLYSVANENQWNKNYSGNYIATFKNSDNLKQTAEFSGSGAMVKSKVEYQPDAVPQNVSEAIAAQYPNVKITEAARLQLPGVAPYYRIKIIGTDNTTKELLVSEEGTVSE